jgi:hypothetical protein
LALFEVGGELGQDRAVFLGRAFEKDGLGGSRHALSTAGVLVLTAAATGGAQARASAPGVTPLAQDGN